MASASQLERDRAKLAELLRDGNHRTLLLYAYRKMGKTQALQTYAKELVDQGKSVLVFSPFESIRNSYKAFDPFICVRKPTDEPYYKHFDVVMVDECFELSYRQLEALIIPRIRAETCRVIMIGTPMNGDLAATFLSIAVPLRRHRFFVDVDHEYDSCSDCLEMDHENVLNWLHETKE